MQDRKIRPPISQLLHYGRNDFRNRIEYSLLLYEQDKVDKL